MAFSTWLHVHTFFVKIPTPSNFFHNSYTVTDVSYFGVTKIDYAHLSIQFVKDVIAKLNTGMLVLLLL